MKITYLFHSGFAIETHRSIVIIDYYHDTDVVGGYVRDNLLHDTRRKYILASHFHPDHFTPEILNWQEEYEGITYILSKDILRHRRLPKECANWIVKGGIFEDKEIRIEAFGSTDVGVSFYIQIDSHTIFHAGDLNIWAFGDDDAPTAERRTKHFLGEMKDINKRLTETDVAMFPIDARLGDTFTDGAYAFLERMKTKIFIPMHFSECGVESARLFKDEAERMGTMFWIPERKGDSLLVP